jgi:phosphoglycerate dehydrogenase-like enzyme
MLADHLAAMRAIPGGPPVEVVEGDWGAVVQPGDIVVVDYFVDRACVREAARRGAAWLHILSAGINAFPVAELDVPVITCSRGISAGPISEFVLAMMLAHEKQLAAVFRHEPVDERLGELGGRRLAVLGLGGIGGRVAQLGLAFGMQVRGMRRRRAPLPAALAGVELVDQVAALAAGADHLVLCAPLTGATHHVIDARVLRQVQPGAHLVNVARGGLVDHGALLDALDAGRVGRASLDVTEPEPLPPDHPLRHHPRVTVTPHLSGLVEQAEPRNWGAFVDNLGRYVEGRDLLGVVDRDAGY